MSKIPKIIHQIWIGPKKPPFKWLNSWKDKHSDWEYRLWTTTYYKIRNQEAYNSSPRFCGKADILRYEILYDYGGFYIDADTLCLRKLDSLLSINEDMLFVKHGKNNKDLLANGIMATVPKNKFFKRLIDDIPAKPSPAAWIETGPVYLTNKVKAEKPNAKILEHDSFIPYHFKDGEITPQMINKAKANGSYGVHYWGSTNNTYQKGEFK